MLKNRDNYRNHLRLCKIENFLKKHFKDINAWKVGKLLSDFE